MSATFGSYAGSFNRTINGWFSFLDHPIANNLLRVILFLYAYQFVARFPVQISAWLDNAYGRFLLMFLFIWLNSKDATLSILMTLGITTVFNLISGTNIFEFFKVEQNTDVAPSCVNIKMMDILTSFNGDEESLMQTLYNIGLPKNIQINDENAPIIATRLLNYGHRLPSPCGLI